MDIVSFYSDFKKSCFNEDIDELKEFINNDIIDRSTVAMYSFECLKRNKINCLDAFLRSNKIDTTTFLSLFANIVHNNKIKVLEHIIKQDYINKYFTFSSMYVIFITTKTTNKKIIKLLLSNKIIFNSLLENFKAYKIDKYLVNEIKKMLNLDKNDDLELVLNVIL